MCISGCSVFVTEVAKGLAGYTVKSTEEHPLPENPNPAAIAAPLQAHLDTLAKGSKRLGIAVPVTHCCYATHERDPESDTTDRGSSLPATLRGAFGNRLGNYVSERRTLKAAGQHFETVIMCGRRFLTGVMNGLKNDGRTPPPVFQPSPWASMAAGTRRRSAPKGTSGHPWLCALLDRAPGTHQVILMLGKQVIAWKETVASESEEIQCLRKAVVRLALYARRNLRTASPKVIRLEGTGRRLADAAAMLEETGFDVEREDRDVLLAEEASVGAALASLGSHGEVCDLGRELRPPPSIRSLIPWGDMAVHAVLVAALGLFLGGKLFSIHRNLDAVHRENAAWTELSDKDDIELKDRFNAVASQVNAFNKFFEKQEVWTRYMRRIPDWLPDHANLTGLEGTAPLAMEGGEAGPGRDPRSLQIRCAADLPEDGSAPEEIDQFVASLRSQPLISRRLPIVELASVRWGEGDTDRRAFCTVLCLPKREFRVIVHEDPSDEGDAS